MLASNPGGLDVKTRGEDVGALAVVGEVRTLIRQGGGTHGHGILSSGRGVIASVSVVISSGNGEVKTGFHACVDSILEGLGLATTETHVGNTALESLHLAVLSIFGLLKVRLHGPLDTLNDIGHRARATGAENLDSIEVGLLGDTILLASDGSGAVSAVAVTIGILIVAGDSLAPGGTTFKVDMVDVDTSINSVSVNTLTAFGGIEVLVEGAEGEAITVRDTSQTPRGVLLGDLLHGVDFGVLLDVFDLEAGC